MGDPYADLGLPYGADPETVKDAFSRLSRRLTPERRAAEPEAAAAYAKIAAAYADGRTRPPSASPPRRSRRRASSTSSGRWPTVCRSSAASTGT